MATRLVQLTYEDGGRGVAQVQDDGTARRVRGAPSTYVLAQSALADHMTLDAVVRRQGLGEPTDLAVARREQRLLPPIDHPDPAHLTLSGTGLTHLGSARGRDMMHRNPDAGPLTDSMRMFLLGVEGGKPAEGAVGVQPEWFYKGDGSCIVGCGQPLVSPYFALDGGEEPEIAGIYLVDEDGNPARLGYCLANEFSDHVTERANYLYLAHSKLRPAALGAELLTGELPGHVEGVSRILRDGSTIWERPFLSGSDNMSHTLENLEHHHFKYGLFRRPGDVHVHFFGTATLSFSEDVQVRPGDIFEIAAAPFTIPLTNPLAVAEPRPFSVRAL